jgi:hypothetical protein
LDIGFKRNKQIYMVGEKNPLKEIKQIYMVGEKTPLKEIKQIYMVGEKTPLPLICFHPLLSPDRTNRASSR